MDDNVEPTTIPENADPNLVSYATGETVEPTVDESQVLDVTPTDDTTVLPEVVDELVEVKPETAPTSRGAPTKYTDATVGLIIAALQRGLSVTDACVSGGINTDTYYEWIKKYPEFSDKIEHAKGRLVRQSRLIVSEAIEKDKDRSMAKWVLEKKDPEFNPKQQVELGGSVGVEAKDDKLFEYLEEMKAIATNAANTGNEPSPTEPSEEPS